MIRIERPRAAPVALCSKAAEEKRRRMLDFMTMPTAQRAQTNVPTLDDTLPGLLEALCEMTSGRCAYCEQRTALKIHRFRPASGALPQGGGKSPHLYYYWLADAWQNLLPICGECSPRLPIFPVTGRRAPVPSAAALRLYVEFGEGLWASPIVERPVLLDPTADSALETHLSPLFNGELVGLSARGRATIEAFGLNRLDLQVKRKDAYRERLSTLVKLVRWNPHDGQAWSDVFDFQNIEFSGTWYYLLKRLGRVIEATTGERVSLKRAEIARRFRNLSALPNEEGANLIQAAIEQATTEPQPPRAGRRRGPLPRAEVRPAKITITNFKSIGDLTLKLPDIDPNSNSADPVPSLLILGENSTGKSSVLEAIALALASDAAREWLEINWNQLRLDPRQLGGTTGSESRATLVTVEFDGGGHSSVQAYRDGFGPDTTLTGREVPIFAYGAFRRFATGAQGGGPARYVRNLFDHEPLPNPEPWLQTLSPEVRNMVIRDLRDLLSIDGDFDVIRPNPRAKRLDMISRVTRPNGTSVETRTPLRSVSSGFRSMLAMVCDIMRGLLDGSPEGAFDGFRSAQGVVLIDEIEAHLHPRWKMQVMTSLRHALPNMTFIVTTHDPLCLRGMRDGEVIVLQRVADPGEGQSVRIEQVTELPDITAMRVDQLLTSDLFQLFSTTDSTADLHMARIADLLAQRRDGAVLRPTDEAMLRDFDRDISKALPVGSSEVHRMVQECVAEYLRARRDASAPALAALRDATKRDILSALETL